MEPTHKLREVLMSLMTNSRADRNSDYALYADYINIIRPDIASNRYYEVMKKHKEYGLYSFKAVERERRAIQSQAREEGEISLLSDKQVAQWRKQQEEEYSEQYSRGNK